MPRCSTCGILLEPPVRTPHTVYTKRLYHVAGKTFCRHHALRAAVSAGLITEVRSG